MTNLLATLEIRCIETEACKVSIIDYITLTRHRRTCKACKVQPFASQPGSSCGAEHRFPENTGKVQYSPVQVPNPCKINLSTALLRTSS